MTVALVYGKCFRVSGMVGEAAALVLASVIKLPFLNGVKKSLQNLKLQHQK
jgi:hypothetical protein